MKLQYRAFPGILGCALIPFLTLTPALAQAPQVPQASTQSLAHTSPAKVTKPSIRKALSPLLPPTEQLYRKTGITAVALTFDDGPSPQWTGQVLDLLASFKIHAMFCLIGTQVQRYPGLVLRIVREGHTLCNHTTTHDLQLASKSLKHIAADIATAQKLITKASGGVSPRYFRAPGGRWSPQIIHAATQQGLSSVDWTVDPRDWSRPPVNHLVNFLLHHIRPGAIVLLHDGGGNRGNTLAALRAILPIITKQYRFCSLTT